MNKKNISEALGEMSDKYITEAINYKKKRSKRWLAIAACICLFIGFSLDAIDRFGIFYMGCGAQCGEIIDGTYYYSVRHKGLYSYSPEEGNKKLLSKYWYDGYEVNEYGVYYYRGRKLYVRIHESGEKKLLYRAGLFKSSDISITLLPDGNLIVTVYNSYKNEIFEVLIDGKTGEVLETVMETKDIDYDGLSYSDEEEYEYEEEQNMLLLRPDGKDEAIVFSDHGVYTGNSQYLFISYGDKEEVWCYDIENRETWKLEVDSSLTTYYIETDGVYVYSCAPWDEAQILWKLVYDAEGKPKRMELVDENIRK